jgi:hypothetical protein
VIGKASLIRAVDLFKMGGGAERVEA